MSKYRKHSSVFLNQNYNLNCDCITKKNFRIETALVDKKKQIAKNKKRKINIIPILKQYLFDSL